MMSDKSNILQLLNWQSLKGELLRLSMRKVGSTTIHQIPTSSISRRSAIRFGSSLAIANGRPLTEHAGVSATAVDPTTFELIAKLAIAMANPGSFYSSIRMLKEIGSSGVTFETLKRHLSGETVLLDQGLSNKFHYLKNHFENLSRQGIEREHLCCDPAIIRTVCKIVGRSPEELSGLEDVSVLLNGLFGSDTPLQDMIEVLREEGKRAAPVQLCHAPALTNRTIIEPQTYQPREETMSNKEITINIKTARYAELLSYKEPSGMDMVFYDKAAVNVTESSAEIADNVCAYKFFSQTEAEINGERLTGQRKELKGTMYIGGEVLEAAQVTHQIEHLADKDLRQVVRIDSRIGTPMYFAFRPELGDKVVARPTNIHWPTLTA